MTPVCDRQVGDVLPEIKEYIVHVFETDDKIPPILLGEPTYKLGPFKSYEEADDAFFVACYNHQDDDVFWHPITIERPLKRNNTDDQDCGCP